MSLCRGRAAARLNSGVSSQKKWFSAKSFLLAKAKELPCSTLARAPAYLGPDTPPRGDAFLGFKPKPAFQSLARKAGFSELTIRSSRDRFAASARCGKLVHLAVAANRPGLAQALARRRNRFQQRAFLPPNPKSFPDPVSPALRHISDLIRLRAVTEVLASSQTVFPGTRHQKPASAR